jgi:hypothetical protein
MAPYSAGYKESDKLDWEARERIGGGREARTREGAGRGWNKKNAKECQYLQLDYHCLQITRRYGALILHAVLLDEDAKEGEGRRGKEMANGQTYDGFK